MRSHKIVTILFPCISLLLIPSSVLVVCPVLLSTPSDFFGATARVYLVIVSFILRIILYDSCATLVLNDKLEYNNKFLAMYIDEI